MPLEVFSTLYQKQLELGPIGLAIQFSSALFVTAIITWFVFRRRLASFWKKTDYVYFLFTIIGGATAAADLAINSWTKESEHVLFSYELGLANFQALVAQYQNMCKDRNHVNAHGKGEDGTRGTAKDYSGSYDDRFLGSTAPLQNSDLVKRLTSDTDCSYINTVWE